MALTKSLPRPGPGPPGTSLVLISRLWKGGNGNSDRWRKLSSEIHRIDPGSRSGNMSKDDVPRSCTISDVYIGDEDIMLLGLLTLKFARLLLLSGNKLDRIESLTPCAEWS